MFKPNVKNMGLEKAGVEFDLREGIKINNKLQSTNKNIFSVGDACMKYQFTHTADITARYAIRNALFFGKENIDKVVIPWCTFTDPEIAHVGKYPREMEAEGIEFETYMKYFDHLDRALCEGVTGLIKIHCKKGSDEMLGATSVGGPAGDIIHVITCCMFNKIGLSKMGACVHIYPTFAESFRHLADQYNRKKLTPTAKVFLRKLLDWKR
jgi:pyruvate/2-oxoglutarate dehydrogenase complex dihydrolipoamide dehydrogenase (E3) component